MGYYDNLPSFKPVVDPQSFSAARMLPEDRATMGMRMDAAVPDAAPAQRNMPMPRFPANWTVRPGISTRPQAIQPSPITVYRDNLPTLSAPPVDSYIPKPPIMNPQANVPLPPTRTTAAQDAVGDIAGKTFIPYMADALNSFGEGNYSRAAGATLGGIGSAVVGVPTQAAKAAYSGLLPKVNEFVAGARGVPSNQSPAPPSAATSPAAPPPAAPPPAATPPANAGGPRTASPGPQDQSLTDRYPDRFKHVPGFGQVLNGGANSGRTPLSPQEQLYNAEVMKGLQLENRARELENVDRYRATQLHDNRALATLQATHGTHGLGHGLEREQQNPETKGDALRQQMSMIDERRNAVTNALFDQNNPDAASKIMNGRQAYKSYKSVLEALGIAAPTFEEMMQSDYGRTYNPKTGYYEQKK